MKFNKLNIENTRKYVVDIKRRYELIEGITIKVSRYFFEALESSIGHIMKNKKIYKRLVVYIAFLMCLYTIPEIVYIIEKISMSELINYINHTPKYILSEYIVKFLGEISVYVVSILTLRDVFLGMIKRRFDA